MTTAPSKPEATPDHHCPGCGRPQRAFPRYPWFFCRECLALAETYSGRRVSFFNASLIGGLAWCFADEPAFVDDKASHVICLVHRRRVLVCEARFGGVVAQPIHTLSPYLERVDPKRFVDLSGNGSEEAASVRLVAWPPKR